MFNCGRIGCFEFTEAEELLFEKQYEERPIDRMHCFIKRKDYFLQEVVIHCQLQMCNLLAQAICLDIRSFNPSPIPLSLCLAVKQLEPHIPSAPTSSAVETLTYSGPLVGTSPF